MNEQEKGGSLNPKYKSSISLISLVYTPYPSISGGLHPLKWTPPVVPNKFKYTFKDEDIM